MRLAFSVAAHLEPEILLVDEVLAVGDADFQKKCLGRMEDLGGSGRTVLFVSHSMPSILRLCPRVILLDGGRLEADGPAAASVEAYFNSGAAAGAERRWNRLEEAPGDEIVRLKSVRVVGEVGETTAEIDIRRPVGIEVEHWNVGVGSGVRPATFLRFFNQEGVQLFSTANFHSPDWEEVSSRSDVVRSTCWIPGNFLAEGRVTVLAGLVSLDPKVVHAREPDAVAFHVFDRSVGDGVRGHFPTDWEGVVRPWLDWIVVPGSRSFGDDDGLPTDPAVEPLVRPLAHGHRRQP
jgi:lipopolysaccharide transport system ATP-binding protein